VPKTTRFPTRCALAEVSWLLVPQMNKKSWLEILPYPKGWMKWLYKTPILLYRLGLGFLVGRLFMIMTTVGRKSGQPCRTAIEFHEYKGRRYVFSAWGMKADWYRNIATNPTITIQTWRGAESVLDIGTTTTPLTGLTPSGDIPLA
jgi:hypothetical protein